MGSSQITYTTRLRLTILHFGQRRLTDAFTFMGILPGGHQVKTERVRSTVPHVLRLTQVISSPAWPASQRDSSRSARDKRRTSRLLARPFRWRQVRWRTTSAIRTGSPVQSLRSSSFDRSSASDGKAQGALESVSWTWKIMGDTDGSL